MSRTHPQHHRGTQEQENHRTPCLLGLLVLSVFTDLFTCSVNVHVSLTFHVPGHKREHTRVVPACHMSTLGRMGVGLSAPAVTRLSAVSWPVYVTCRQHLEGNVDDKCLIRTLNWYHYTFYEMTLVWKGLSFSHFMTLFCSLQTRFVTTVLQVMRTFFLFWRQSFAA